ncbi:MAG: hypothetical protein LBR26_05585 [Prevotella sp.]|jgi:hypothetical protein|nr:hypothetical protein [Prevotella sp.]
MNRNAVIQTLFIIVTSICSYSCSDDPEPPAPLDGEWFNEMRILESNDNDVNGRVNGMFAADSRQLLVKRVFEINKSHPDMGVISTLAVDPESGVNVRKRESTYTLKGDSLYIVDGTLGNMPGTIVIKRNRLTTVSRLNKQAIKAIITEIGGDINIPVRDDIEGILTIIDVKK